MLQKLPKSFDLPTDKSQSCESARHWFHWLWGEPFNGTDDDVRFIAKQVPSSNYLQQHQPFGTASRCVTMLWIMRENSPTLH